MSLDKKENREERVDYASKVKQNKPDRRRFYKADRASMELLLFKGFFESCEC